MKQTKTISAKRFKEIVNAYLLDAIDYSERTVKAVDQSGNITEIPVICNNDKEKVNFIMSTFESEYLHKNNEKQPRQIVFSEWLQGLPSCFNIAWENYRILELAKKWESIPQDATEAQEDKILENWFKWIANKFFQLHHYLNLE